MRSAWLLLAVLLSIAGCTGSVSPPQNQTAQQLLQQQQQQCAAGACPCNSPAGPIASGGTVTVFGTSQVACGQSCQSQATTVTCNNGTFSQDVSQMSFACSVGACSACSLGQTLIPDGTNVIAYNTATADCGQSCEDHQITRLCTNGVLSGDNSYNQGNCQPATCECQLPDASGFLTLGGSMTFYSTKQATCGQTCAALSQSRTCTSSGTGNSRTFAFSGSNTFTYSTCTNPSAASCQCALPNGLGNLANGQTFVLSSSPSSACTPCSSLPGETVLCQSGSLVDATTLLPTTPASKGYIYQCVDKTCPNCTLPGYGTIGNGSTVTLYSQSSIACGVDPSTATYKFTCSNTVLTANGAAYNTSTGPTTWYTTMAPTCTGCTSGWGETFAVNTVVTMYKTNTFTGGPCGQSCSSVARTCQANGIFTGDTTFTLQACPSSTACNQQGGGAPPRTCLLPWQNSFVTPGAQIPMWSKKTVPCGDSCQNYFKVGTCQISTGTFDAGFSYIYPACTELCQ